MSTHAKLIIVSIISIFIISTISCILEASICYVKIIYTKPSAYYQELEESTILYQITLGDLDEIHPFTQTLDGTQYEIGFMYASSLKYHVLVIDPQCNLVQIETQNNVLFTGVEFYDVNFDNYIDIIIGTGGTMNETHDLLIYNPASKKFIPVEYVGFNFLSYFEIHDGFLRTWLKESASKGVVLDLYWIENLLVVEDKYEYDDT